MKHQNVPTQKILQDITNGQDYKVATNNKENIKPHTLARVPLQDITNSNVRAKCDKLNDKDMAFYINAFYHLPLQGGKVQMISRFLDKFNIRQNENAFCANWKKVVSVN